MTGSYQLAHSVDEALAIHESFDGHCRYIAGGTDSELLRKQNLHEHAHTIDLSTVDQLRHITMGENLTIGSNVTLQQLSQHEDIGKRYSILARAARAIASPVIRYTATVGGNLLVSNRCNYYNQSNWWRESIGSCLRDKGDVCQVVGTGTSCFSRNISDLAPALIVHHAVAVIATKHGEVSKPLADLYRADGLNSLRHLDDGAILIRLEIASPPPKSYYRKLRLRKSVDFASLTVAGSIYSDGRIRVCLNGISMAPVVIDEELSSITLATIQSMARKRASTVDNDIMPLAYRRKMMDVYLEQCWEKLVVAGQ